ncbi:HTH-type transcriptional regulator CynR [Pigmentiphaga humi]|uniref:HTH-type transcriptional regulator CynR n=1 Tax=Pigmentiphaga humi TaxID=2478468 RepID=A0A3P4B6A0_9BURK|nr:LysR family transcriptional regulator [Pigmentiphaga humi]VCU71056.1 HTH-type transcriptional regulator CynR [Pigmentiphaga humi]
MNLSLRHFKAFLALADTHSFTRAAQALHISQPGLSLMMQEMENQLSCKLLERTTRSVDLTPAGRRLLISARRIVDEMDGVTPVLSQLSVEQRRTLHIASTQIFCANVMSHVYVRLRRNHPAIDLRIVDVHRPEVERLVRSGEVDCGLGIFSRRLPDMSRKPLFQFGFRYVEARDAPVLLGMRNPPARLAWSDLPDVPFVELNATSELQQFINQHKSRAGRASAAVGIRFNNLESLVGMVAAGVGPTILPSFAAPEPRRTEFVSVLLTDPSVDLDFHMITKRGRAQPAALQAFTDTLCEVIAERGGH